MCIKRFVTTIPRETSFESDIHFSNKSDVTCTKLRLQPQKTNNDIVIKPALIFMGLFFNIFFITILLCYNTLSKI